MKKIFYAIVALIAVAAIFSTSYFDSVRWEVGNVLEASASGAWAVLMWALLFAGPALIFMIGVGQAEGWIFLSVFVFFFLLNCVTSFPAALFLFWLPTIWATFARGRSGRNDSRKWIVYGVTSAALLLWRLMVWLA